MKRPRAPFMRPATSSEAMTVNAVTKLGYTTAYVVTVWASFHSADAGVRELMMEPHGSGETTNTMNAMRASGSLKSRPPATRGSTYAHNTYAGSRRK